MCYRSRQRVNRPVLVAVSLVCVVSSPASPSPSKSGKRVPTERMAAFHKTVVITDEAVPHSAVFTYLTKRFTYTENNFLAKIMPVVTANGERVACDRAERVAVEDTPGGVAATFTLASIRVESNITPLFVGRGARGLEGAVLYRVRSGLDGATTAPVGRDNGNLSLIINADRTGLRKCEAAAIAEKVTLLDGTAVYTAGEERIPVAVRCSDALTLEADGTLRATFPRREGHLLIAFAENADRAIALARRDARTASDEVAAYYDRLTAVNGIETPEPAIDAAFTHAMRTLEYTWIEPIGWLECIHHWFSLWHMQATAGAEWIGQADRSRACTLAHAAQLTADGAVPQFSPSGHVHRDFGGSNQYWAWQVRHYWQFTADHTFAEQAASAMDKVLVQTSQEYDKDGNGLLAWGLQIGNQEDYVATPYDGTTPSVEGINMLLTGAELARALGEPAEAERYVQRAARARNLLREKLWIPELGRYAFFIDPLGSRRLDGQYHTLAYPVIWGLADPLDGYTMLRHVQDRLTGAGGEVYCSNNFPNHVGGTWGMQAGAAQQPWAAWALSAAGQFEQTYKPLAAVAGWVMNADHRGSWPEVAAEATPAYFSPPAGLFVASTVEALFGLKVDAPNRVLHVAPSFPSHWPKANLRLADYRAEYLRDRNHFAYTVESKSALERRFSWHLPPCRISRVRIDGADTTYEVEPAVNAVRLLVRAPAAASTTLSVDFEPLDVAMISPQIAAEGESIRVEVKGANITEADDRCGVLSRWKTSSPQVLEARLRDSLLDPFDGYGRLGQLTFSRRTFFVLCTPPDATSFWKPVDLAVLPRCEIAPAATDGSAKSVRVGSDGESLLCELLVRNNTREPLTGTGRLRLAGGDYPLNVDVPPRSQRSVTATVPARMAGLLAPGDNAVALTLPGGTDSVETQVAAIEPFEKLEPLARATKAGLERVPLDPTHMIPDTEWTRLRVFSAYPHMPWAGSRPPLEALAGRKTIACPDLPHVDFALPDRKFIPVSFKAGRPAYTLDLKARLCRKLFVLVVPFLDNHDMFATVGRITVRSPEDIVYSRQLRFPGDVDWWSPPAIVGDFATIGRNPRERHGLLPLPTTNAADWAEGRPPAFPQPGFWSDSCHVTTAGSVMSVLEIDLGRFVEVASLTLESLGADPAFGLVAVTALTAGGQTHLADSPWNPPAVFRQPKTLFDFEKDPALTGWSVEGPAFSVSSVPSLFATPTLNSLGAAGEAATGRATSPAFALGPADSTLLVRIHGGLSKSEEGPGLLALDLLDARDGRRLHRLVPGGTHNLRWERIDVRRWSGQTIQLQLVDQNTDAAFAWLGVAAVRVVSE